MNPRLIVCSLVVLMSSTTSTIVEADCITATINVAEAFRHSDVVFSGIVTKTDDINDRLSFRVDRVWKGPVGRDIWMYHLDRPSTDSYVFRPRPDIKYIIFARELSADDRKFRNKIDELTAFGIQGSCGDGPRFSKENARQLDRLARGRAPRN